jgi:C-terminal processing protease CtpA/Prc
VLRAERDPARRFSGKVAVLMGPKCMSSNEAFLLMARATGARLFGERSAGSSGNPRRFELGGGVTVSVPSWEAQDTAGNIVEGRGVAPDETVVFEPESADDAVLEAALKWLRE